MVPPAGRCALAKGTSDKRSREQSCRRIVDRVEWRREADAGRFEAESYKEQGGGPMLYGSNAG